MQLWVHYKQPIDSYMNENKGIVKTSRPAIAQSNELTEAAYYLSLQAKRVLWLCLMETYRQEDHPGTFTVRVADYQRLFKVSQATAVQMSGRALMPCQTALLPSFHLMGSMKNGNALGWQKLV